jgi:hypothetical protein
MAAAGWFRRAAAAAAPRLPSGLPLIPPPPPALLAEAQSLVVPGLGAAVGPAMELMAVPKKKVYPLLLVILCRSSLLPFAKCLARCGLVVVIAVGGVLLCGAL